MNFRSRCALLAPAVLYGIKLSKKEEEKEKKKKFYKKKKIPVKHVTVVKESSSENFFNLLSILNHINPFTQNH